jgi:hypothetical protein
VPGINAHDSSTREESVMRAVITEEIVTMIDDFIHFMV